MNYHGVRIVSNPHLQLEAEFEYMEPVIFIPFEIVWKKSTIIQPVSDVIYDAVNNVVICNPSQYDELMKTKKQSAKNEQWSKRLT